MIMRKVLSFVFLLSSTASEDSILSLYERVVSMSYATLSSRDLWALLTFLGADAADIEHLAVLWKEAVAQQDEHANKIYPHKGTLTSYYRLEIERSDVFRVQRATSENAIKIPGHVIEHIDPTTINGANASFLRIHKQWPVAADTNSVFVAIQRLVALLMASHHAHTADADEDGGGSSGSTGSTESPRAEYEAMVSGYRVIRSADHDGDPGPEGVHQDAADLTVAIMMRRQNVAEGSGGNRIWSLDQPCGKPDEDSLQIARRDGRLLLSHTLYERFDALFVLDREVKHEARQIFQADETAGPAIRDVLTIEVRRPRQQLRSHRLPDKNTDGDASQQEEASRILVGSKDEI